MAAGADYLGLIFVAGSARAVAAAEARKIARAMRGRAKLVGVFQNSSADHMLAAANDFELDLFQCHGDEQPDLVRILQIPVIKAITIDVAFTWEKVEPWCGVSKYVLFDRPKSDTTPGWLPYALDIVDRAPRHVPPFFFAGGLTPENISTVLERLQKQWQAPDLVGLGERGSGQDDMKECRTAKLIGVDVASGLESAPGIKDYSRMQSFCKQVKQEEQSCLH